VLFGIAFEALSKDQDETLAILEAMKKILRPAVAGHAIYQDHIFSETVELLSRLALTESMIVQASVVEISRHLCLAHPSVGAESEQEERLSDDIEQLFELTKIIILVLVGIVPNLDSAHMVKRQDFGAEATALILKSLNALVDVAKIFPLIIRADLYASIINIFIKILGTGICQEVIIPRSLPILKRFVQSLVDDLDDIPSLGDQVRNCLRRFRTILAMAQRRENEASLPCARNTLMASSILFTSGSECIPAKDPEIVNFLEDLMDCIGDVGLGKVAANCVRSLLLTEPKTETGQVVAAYLLPRVLTFILDDERQDPEKAKLVLLHALTSLAANLKGSQGSALVCILVPTLLQRARSNGKDLYGDTAGRLLSLAGADAPAFRAVMGSMHADERAFVGEVMREGGVGSTNVSQRDSEEAEPTIALKLNFG